MPAARIQPQGRVRLNRQSRLAQGALAVVSATDTINLATGTKLTVAGSGYAKAATPVGIATQFRKNFYLETEVLPAIGTQSFVEFWFGYTKDYRNLGNPGGGYNQGFLTGSSLNNIGIAGGGNVGGSGDSWGAVYNWPAVNLAGEVLTLGALTVLVQIRKQDRMELWHDGRLIQTLTQSPTSYPAQTMILGSFVEDTAYWPSSSDTLLAGRIVNDWSADDVKAFCRNPWQLLEGQAPLLYAASVPSGGATATPSGISSSSAVGSATVTGQAMASPAGVAATAAVGTATASGTTVVNGTASPAGVSAAASVGAAVASGQGKATPAGVSSTASVGTATAIGAASSTGLPAGVSATASVGAAFASGQAKALPPGVSATAAVGTPLASGTAIITAYPAGVQAVASVGVAIGKGAATAAPLGVVSQIYVGVPYAYGPFDISSYPKFNLFTLMRADPVSAAGAMQGITQQFTLMRSDSLSAASAMSSAPLNYSVNLI